MNSIKNLSYYEVNFIWNSETQGTLSSPIGSGKIETEIPFGFPKRSKEKWTPEHLFIAAVSSSLMTNFLLVADNSKFEFISFESDVIGKIEKINGSFAVTEITLKPKLTISPIQSETKAKHAIELSSKACTIANSLNTKIIIETSIAVQ